MGRRGYRVCGMKEYPRVRYESDGHYAGRKFRATQTSAKVLEIEVCSSTDSMGQLSWQRPDNAEDWRDAAHAITRGLLGI